MRARRWRTASRHRCPAWPQPGAAGGSAGGQAWTGRAAGARPALADGLTASAWTSRRARWPAAGPGRTAGRRLRDHPALRPGAVHPTPAPPGGGGTACCGLIVKGPQPDWTPQQVVSGFLLASASFAHRPRGRAGVPDPRRQQVVAARHEGDDPRPERPRVYQQPGRLSGQDSRASRRGELAGARNAERQRAVHRQRRRRAARQQVFTLESVKGQWRIDSLPATGSAKVSHELLLPSVLFRLDYAPRNLYFYGQPGELLVPDPVFVPVESSDLVTTLVNGLLTRSQRLAGERGGHRLPAGRAAAGRSRSCPARPAARPRSSISGCPAAHPGPPCRPWPPSSCGR